MSKVILIYLSVFLCLVALTNYEYVYFKLISFLSFLSSNKFTQIEPSIQFGVVDSFNLDYKLTEREIAVVLSIMYLEKEKLKENCLYERIMEIYKSKEELINSQLKKFVKNIYRKKFTVYIFEKLTDKSRKSAAYNFNIYENRLVIINNYLSKRYNFLKFITLRRKVLIP